MKWQDLKVDAQSHSKIVLAIAMIAGLAVVKFYQSTTPVVQLERTAHQSTHTASIETSGQVRAGVESFMTLRTGGRLDEIKIEQGQPVKKGDIILMVDVAKNRAELQSALSRYRYASAEFGRNRNLLAAAAGTRQAYEETQNTMTVARSDLETARQKLEDSIIRAPNDGVVTLIAFKVGDFIPDGSRVAVVEDHTSYEIMARLPLDRESEIPKSATLTLTSLKRGAASKSYSVPAEIESLAALASMVSQDFDVRIRFTTLPEGLTVKDQVKINIPLKVYENVDVVKLQTVFDIQTTPRILTMDDYEKPRWTPVEIVDIKEDNVYIKALKSGLQVVVPTEGVSPLNVVGKRVSVREAPKDRG